LHASWDPDLTDDQPGACVTSGTVALTAFHFLAAYQYPVVGVSVDWTRLDEQTGEHAPQSQVIENPTGYPWWTPPPCAPQVVSDPENWMYTNWALFMDPYRFIGFHHAPYQVQVQYRYWVEVLDEEGFPIDWVECGPEQVSITVNVQNLVVTSSDERKVLKWDPERPEIRDTSFNYRLDCAQTKQCDVTLSIYATDGTKVYEMTEQKMCPGNYSFTWDGTADVGEVPLAPRGLYVFDIVAVNPLVHSFVQDADCLRSRALWIGDHDVVEKAPNVYQVGYILHGAGYIFHSGQDASEAWVEVWSPELTKIAGPVNGGIHAIPSGATPQAGDGNFVQVPASLDKASDDVYRFVFWARDNYLDIYKDHHNNYALTNMQVKIMGCVLATGHFYQKGFGPWFGLVRDLDSKALADWVVDRVQNVVAKVGVVGRTWWVIPDRQVTLKAIYKPTANFTRSQISQWGVVNFTYKDNDGAGKFAELLGKLTAVNGSGIVHFGGHAVPGVIGFPHDEGIQYFFGISSANPKPEYGCVDISTVTNPLTPQDPKPFKNIRVVYLGGCKSFLNPCLPQGFVDRGTKSAVGWKVTILSVNPDRDDAPSRAFWRTLTGDMERRL
jgi:hypothetical protein